MKLSNCQIVKFLIVFIFYLLTLHNPYFILHTSTHATNMSSDDYQIQIDDLSISGSNKQNTNHKPPDNLLRVIPRKYKSKDDSILGVEAVQIQATSPFSFTISDLSIDFGSLISENPSIQTNTLTVSGNSYSVGAFENHPLRSLTNSSVTIPDTTCNGGVQTCDETTAKIWNDDSTYGFGFNMSGDDISVDFVDSTYYRQFANNEAGESFQEVMTSNSGGQNRNATVTFKVNISSIQAVGEYENAITFIATPGY